jgi:hypothetical protein
MLCLIVGMKPFFDSATIRAQIENLQSDRERIDQAIRSLEAALRSMEDLNSHQKEFPLFDPNASQDTTVLDAVKHACLDMVDDITRQRVLSRIERQYPALKPNSSSVSAALINLARGESPMLKLASKGRGRSPAVYSTEGETVTKLNSEEIGDLMAPINGVGGWQSLWATLQEQFDKATGQITLSPLLRSRLHRYYQAYGGGGYQNRAKRVFRREFPHLFAS